MRRPPARVPEEGAPRTLARAQVRSQCLDGLRPERDDALLPALAEDSHGAFAKVHVLHVQPGELGHPDPAGVQHLEDRAVPPAGLVAAEGLAEQRLALVDRKVRR